MAVEVAEVLTKIGEIGLWIQALGLIVILWIVFQVVNFIINRRRIKEIYAIKEDMKRMENKLDRLLRKR